MIPPLLAAAAIAATANRGLATQYNYTGADAGNWNVATNWTVNGGSAHAVPAAPNDDAIIGTVSSSASSLNFNTNYASPGLDSLTINALFVITFTLNQTTSATAMYAAEEDLGTTTYGNVYNQTAGTNTCTDLSLGSSSNAFSQGTYQLSGSGILRANGTENVGESNQTLGGGNVFSQTGGANSCPLLLIGNLGNATGAYNITAGTLNTVSIVVGDSTGSNTFTQSGTAAVTVGDILGGISVGDNNTGPGTYNLNGGTLSLALSASLFIGGTGLFNHTAGSLTFSGTDGVLYIGSDVGNAATYALSGTGTISGAPTEDVGQAGPGTFTQGAGTTNTLADGGLLQVGDRGTGTYNLNDGNFSVTDGAEIIGGVGDGTFTQSSGTNTLSGTSSLNIANDTGTGTYNLNGGTLSLNDSANLYIGTEGNGAFTQTAGSVMFNGTTNELDLGLNGTDGTGTYTLSGTGSISGASLEEIGYTGVGTFTQNGGTNTLATTGVLIVGSGSDAPGTYNLNGGTLTAPTVDVGVFTGIGTFNQTSGILSSSSTITIGANGSYNSTGGTINATSIEVDSGGSLVLTSIGPINTIALNLSGGTFTNSGTFTNNGSLQSSDATTNSGTFTQSGPQTWTAGTTFTNTAGTATFQTDTGSATSSPLAISVTAGTVKFGSTQHLANLLISTGATVTATLASPHSVIVTGALGNLGLINLTNNDLIVRGNSDTAAHNLIAIQSELKSGFNAAGGYWNGTLGINSSSAASDTRFITTLGYRNGGIVFDNTNTTSADVLVKYTYYGDADLNGMVNGADYTKIDVGFGLHLTGWSNGDFNYDGVVNGTDYALIDNAFNQIAATSAAPLALDATPTNLVAGASALSAVPEPATATIIGLVAGLILGRRARRRGV